MPKYYTFWQTDDLAKPPEKLESVDPIGLQDDVLAQLCDIPSIMLDFSSIRPIDPKDTTSAFRFYCMREESHTLLTAYGERKEIDAQNNRIFFLGLASHMSTKGVFVLYVQLRELFGVALFDEQHKKFVTPAEFRRLI